MARTPGEWKDAAAGEEQLTQPLYDTTLSGTAADADILFFNKSESADNREVTNFQQIGVLPTSHRFLLKGFVAFFNDVSAAGDEINVCDRGIFELLLNNKRVFLAPLRMLIGKQTTLPSGVTLDESFVVGEGFMLESYIIIKGGVPISGILNTGKTAASVSTALTIALLGELVRPSG